jgi:hypothetical protein
VRVVSLLDIGELSKMVPIRGKELEVTGIPGEVFLELLAEFPEMRKLMAGAGHKLEPNDLMKQVPAAVASVIAAATGTPGNDKAIAMARRLSLGEQVELLRAIWELTFPQGVTSFIEALEALKGQADASGLGAVMASPEPSSSSSQEDTPQPQSGDTRLG